MLSTSSVDRESSAVKTFGRGSDSKHQVELMLLLKKHAHPKTLSHYDRTIHTALLQLLPALLLTAIAWFRRVTSDLYVYAELFRPRTNHQSQIAFR